MKTREKSNFAEDDISIKLKEIMQITKLCQDFSSKCLETYKKLYELKEEINDYSIIGATGEAQNQLEDLLRHYTLLKEKFLVEYNNNRITSSVYHSSASDTDSTFLDSHQKKITFSQEPDVISDNSNDWLEKQKKDFQSRHPHRAKNFLHSKSIEGVRKIFK